MENSPLNKAHQLERRAEALLKQKKFDESTECFKSVIKYLYEALECTNHPGAKESIQLQINHHYKQIKNMKIKKAHEEHCQHQEALKYIGNFDSISEYGGTLQKEIFRTIEMHDSLMDVLMKRGNDDMVENESIKNLGQDSVKGSNISRKVRQVDDSTLIEELKGLSEKLRELVQSLLSELEEKDSEISRLKAHIYKLECEGNKKDEGKSNNTLRVITDSSGGTSPYVISPCSELSPDVHNIKGLPTLAPLEMPNLDFLNLASFRSSTNQLTDNTDN